MPNGKFAESDFNNLEWVLMSDKKKSGGAATGFDVGLQWNFDIQSVRGLSLLLSVDGILNPVNSDIKDGFEDLSYKYEEDDGEVEYTLPMYLNFPVMLGARYNYDLNENLAIYGEAAMGLAFRKITDLNFNVEYSDDGEEETDTFMYDFSTSFAYRFGAGFIINNKYNIGVSMWNLGASKVKGTARFVEKEPGEGTETEKEKFKFKDVTPTMIMFRLGINL